MGYLRPTDAPISDSWQGHKNRNPPSAEPGTDYACAYGTDLRMPGDGVISVIDTSPGGGEGRRMSIDLDDGRRVSLIHLSRIGGWVGMRVGRGQMGVCWSGASGNGSDWYYGPHVHVSLWERPGMAYRDTIDFELYVGEEPQPEPEPEPEPEWEDEAMPKNSGFGYQRSSDGEWMYGICNLGSGAFHEWMGTDGAYNTAVAGAFDTPTFAIITEGHRNNIYEACRAVRDEKVTFPQIPTPPTRTTEHEHEHTYTLTAPVWVGGVTLALIGFINIVRFVLDYT